MAEWVEICELKGILKEAFITVLGTVAAFLDGPSPLCIQLQVMNKEVKHN
jgi:hypothetical protein